MFKGVAPKKCKIVKHASSELIAAVKKPVPSGQLEAVTQSFAPTPQVKLPRIPKPEPRIPKLEPKVFKDESKYAKEVKRDDNVIEKAEQNAFDANPILKSYQDEQRVTETDQQYKQNTVLYTPQTRKSFYKFISDTYTHDFKKIQQITGKIDENACEKLGSQAIEAFSYQQFIREYIRNASPYRGILVYHGLGSGKTCSAIAAAEAIYGTSNKKIIVMTPFSLRGNFISELSFCGFRHFNVQNHWVEEPVNSERDISYMYAHSVLSLSTNYLKDVLKRLKNRRIIWVPDYTKEANFNDKTPQQQNDIRAQITNMIESRITFISYNGITSAKLKKYACEERFFDNAVIVIDEIHNLTRLMQGQITKYIVKKQGSGTFEPIVPGKWKPTLCDSGTKYNRAYLLYKLLTDARNSKIIGLSGTPIINFPDELGILANVLAGYIECAEFDLRLTYKETDESYKVQYTNFINNFIKIIESEPRVDIIRCDQQYKVSKILISVFNEGYEKTKDEEFIGVVYNPDAQDDIKTVFERLKVKLKAANFSFSEEKYVSYPRLPSDDKDFKNYFIDPVELTIKNEVVLKKRLTGLISYYKGSKKEYMPEIKKDKVIKCKMSNHVFDLYTEQRIVEINSEKIKEKGDKYSEIEEISKNKNASSYRFRSRALCNFAFPKGIQRPFPDTLIEETYDNLTITDNIADVQMDIEIEKEVEEPLFSEAEGGGEEAEAAVLEEVPEAEEPVEEVPVAVPVPEEAPVAVPVAEAPVESVEAPVEAPVEAVEAPVPEEAPIPVPVARKRTIRVATPAQVPVPVEAPVEAVEAPVAPAPVPVARKRTIRVAPAPPVEPEQLTRIVPYQESIRNAMEQLDDDKEEYLMLDSEGPKLSDYSTKMDKMIRKINKIKSTSGSSLVYSQFKTVEGLGVLRLALKANGFVEIEIEGDSTFRFSNATIESFRDKNQKRFIFFTGDGAHNKRTLILNIFNGQFDKIPESMRTVLEPYKDNKNKKGEICCVFGITGAGAEGISLKCCRAVHIMEPYWNKVRLDQVKGRAIRICSHQDLDYKDRSVKIYTYYAIFTKEQMEMLPESIKQRDKNEYVKEQRKKPLTQLEYPSSDDSDDEELDEKRNYIETSDENVYSVAIKKDKINKEILKIMQESAMDCSLNSADNEGIQCFKVEGAPKQYLFDPDLKVDIMQTTVELKEVQYETKETAKETETTDRETASRDSAQVVELRRNGVKEEFIIYPRGLVYDIYERIDSDLSNVIGELSLNPATGTFKGSSPIFK